MTSLLSAPLTTGEGPARWQQPEWPNGMALLDARDELSARAPLVSSATTDALTSRIADVSRGDAFLLWLGDCAETFEGSTPEAVGAKAELLRRSVALVDVVAARTAVPVGRIAGVYGKPRSSMTETRDGVTLPAYRGDAVNGIEFTAESRRADPTRLLTAYDTAAHTLVLLREEAVNREHPIAVSHEALLLDYEQPLIRYSEDGRHFLTSTSLAWLGERTRHPDSPLLALLAEVANPVAVKLGPTTTPSEVLDLAARLDPENTPGRLTFVPRLGAGAVREVLPPLVVAAKAAGLAATWVTDPCHGNGVTVGGRKTRRFGDVLTEVIAFAGVLAEHGVPFGGLHLEATGESVTEVLGGLPGITEDDLPLRYETACDPRLNQRQALELVWHAAGILAKSN